MLTSFEISVVSGMPTEAPTIATVQSTPIASPWVSEGKDSATIIVTIGITEFDATEFNETAGIAYFQ